MTKEFKRYKIEFHRQGVQYQNEFRKTLSGIRSIARTRFRNIGQLCPYTTTVYGTDDPSYRGATVTWAFVQTLERDTFLSLDRFFVALVRSTPVLIDPRLDALIETLRKQLEPVDHITIYCCERGRTGHEQRYDGPIDELDLEKINR